MDHTSGRVAATRRAKVVLAASHVAVSGLSIAAASSGLASWYLRRGRATISTAEAARAALVAGGALFAFQQSVAYLCVRPAARRLEQTAREYAARDGLTGLATRVTFDERLVTALARFQRSGRRFAVAYVDLDHFKEINDERGHLEGDRVLRLAAQRIRGLVRGEDDVARIGGDEFAVLAEGCATVDDARAFALRLHQALAAPPGGEPIGASVGIALAGYLHTGTEAVLGEADDALYAAKHAGRNRIAVAGEGPATTLPVVREEIAG